MQIKQNELALSLAQLKGLTESELGDLQMHYKEVIGNLESKVEAARSRGDEPDHALRAALRHFRTSLGLIKEVRKERNRDVDVMRHADLYHAVGAFIEDDCDDNFEALRLAHAAFKPAWQDA